ncbi:DUF5017 domain-containing protein [Parapedobacter sp. SGR-10]|uniref:DUF5017 domain-containing protein n=1 Tax=Parapedobacter sp. SGR-10 TaxID=2710879 RepID=UPI00197CFFD3|nr:DUF5017 domain-containing protein [Parapedobacter sp. SGR-10]
MMKMTKMTSFLCLLAVFGLWITGKGVEIPHKPHAGAAITTPTKVQLSFNLRYNYPTRTSAKISVLVSTDFNGKRESFEDIQAATWTDITDRCHIDYESNKFTPSGKVDITDLHREGKPIYLAFKYVFDPAEGNRQGATIWIGKVLVEAITDGKTTVLSSDLATDFLKHATGDAHKNPTRSENRDALGTGKSLIMQANFHRSATVEGVTYTNRTRTEEYFVSVPYYVNKK